MKRTMRTIAVAAMSVMVALAASCGGDDGDDGSASTTSTTIDPEVEAEVLAAYEAGYRAFEAAAYSNPVNPDHPALAETMTDSALAKSVEGLQDLEAAGQYTAGPPAVLHARVTSIEGDTARVEDCVDDRSAAYHSDGTLARAGATELYRFTATMVRVDGVWKRAAFDGNEETCLP